MDNEVVVLLKQILAENQEMRREITDIKNEMSVMKNEMINMKNEMTDMKSEMTDMKSEIADVKDEISGVKKEVQKNSIKIEELSKKIDIVSEVQMSHKEQTERQFEELKEELHERFDILETATQNISKDLREVQDEIKALAEISGRHEMDIMVLKRRPV